MNILLQYKFAKLRSSQSPFACLLLWWNRQSSSVIKSLLYWCNLLVFFIVSEPSQIVMKWITLIFLLDGWLKLLSEFFRNVFGFLWQRSIQGCSLILSVILQSFFFFFKLLYVQPDSLLHRMKCNPLKKKKAFVPQKISVRVCPKHLNSYEHYLHKIIITCMSSAIVFILTTFIEVLCKFGLVRPATVLLL